jgi:peptidyl-prolyl cis-trans isomerase C
MSHLSIKPVFQKKSFRVLVGALICSLILTLGTIPARAADDPVVAKVGNDKITLSQFQQELTNLPPNLRQMAANPKVQKEFLEQLATTRLLYQEGVDQGLLKDPKVKKQIDDMTRKIVLGTLLQKEIEGRIKPPTEPQMEQYYKQHLNEFSQEKQVHASHILVKDKATADKLEAKLKKGADFATLAKENSTCPSSSQGGDLGFFTRNRMVKEFSDAAFALKPGEISAPVKTKFGYHIIKVNEIKEASAKPFAEVKAAIRNKLIQEEKGRVFEEYVNSLKKKIKFEIFPEALQPKESKPKK